MSKDQNITGETWKFRSKEVLISEMDKVSVLYAAIHALKRMHYYNKKFHYAVYRTRIAESDEELAKFEEQREKFDGLLMFFANKLECLDERAIELGFEIPEKYEDVKALLSEVEEKQKQT